MRRSFAAVCLPAVLAFVPAGTWSQFPHWPANLPVYDHIVIVVEENKDYDEVIGSAAAPYINDVLRKEGANITQMYAEEHKSQGNYFWLFSGSNQQVGFHDEIPDTANNRNYPFMAPNLGEQLIARRLTFKGYAEDLPEIGSTAGSAGLYARKHVPWVSFGNIPRGKSDSSTNLQFLQFPSDYSKLPTVCFVIPNLVNDMHNGSIPESVRKGDEWLMKNLDPYYQWAKSHNSLLIVTFDESDDRSGTTGLTDPADRRADIKNRIPTLLAGARIIPGDYPEGNGVTHVNILRTIEAMYGLPPAGHQQPNAERFGIPGDRIVTDMFRPGS